MLNEIDPVMFTQKMIEENTPEEFAYIIHTMINSGDPEDFALAVQLMAFSAMIDSGYSMCAAIAFEKLMEDSDE